MTGAGRRGTGRTTAGRRLPPGPRTRPDRRRRSRRPTSLSTRLLVGQLIVVGASIGAAGLVSSLVGPSIFHRHMLEAAPISPVEVRHLEYAFRDAGTVALLTGLVVALAVAALVSWYAGRRLRASLRGITRAAGEVAAGRYEAELPEHGNGQELDELAAAFNTMAETIRHTEATRRRLLTDVGHELRTPLATMSTHLDALEDGIITWDPALQQLFRDEVTRMSALARDISAVSRAEEGAVRLDPVRVDAADVATAAVHELAVAYADKGVELRTDLPAAAPGEAPAAASTTVRVDPARMGQVLVNLLANALRHTPTGGVVTVSVRPVSAARAIEDDSVLIVVHDTGEGITAEQLPHVFERFYRGSAARERDRSGSGVGLTISRALVHRQGGTLDVASAGEGRGSTFTVRLPRA